MLSLFPANKSTNKRFPTFIGELHVFALTGLHYDIAAFVQRLEAKRISLVNRLESHRNNSLRIIDLAGPLLDFRRSV